MPHQFCSLYLAEAAWYHHTLPVKKNKTSENKGRHEKVMMPPGITINSLFPFSHSHTVAFC